MNSNESTIADILIFTALSEELNALQTEFAPTKSVNSTTSPLKYHIVSTSTGLSIAITCLFSMGNTQAGIRSSQAISEINPKYVIMFGIAGGVAETVSIEDIVISTQVYFYESGKEHKDQFEQRPNINSADDFLLHKIQEYAHEIPQNNDIKFGIVAAGEKVIASSTIVETMKSKIRCLAAFEMESYGISQGSRLSLTKPGFIAIRGISDLADEKKNDNHRENALRKAAHFLWGFLSNLELPPIQKLHAEDTGIISIKHISLYQMPDPSEILDEGENLVFYGSLDQTDLFERGKVLDFDSAIKRQEDLLQRIREIQNISNHYLIRYYGLAYIPLIVQMGFSLNRTPVELFGTGRQSGKWVSLNTEENFPEIISNLENITAANNSEEIAITVSVSQKVHESQVYQTISSEIPLLSLQVSDPKLDIVESTLQVNAYAKAFLEVLDLAHKDNPKLKRIHLFLATPPTVAFRIGQQISPIHHGNVIVYNFIKSENPQYKWGIDIKSNILELF